MKKLLERIKAFNQEVTFESLRQFIQTIRLEDLEYKSHVNNPLQEGDYGRNVLSMQPFECVLINWPAGIESAVHHHKGLFGFVWVLEGELENVFYEHKNNNLLEVSIQRFGRNGLIPEPDGVIHKLRNASFDTRAVSLHFYYPAIESFEGMEIFNLENESLGILSHDAETASWSEKIGHFKEVIENAFQFKDYESVHHGKSHIIRYVIPKPAASRIKEMNAAYFCEQADQYDFSDFNHPNRKSYTDTIDQLVADAISSQKKVDHHLDIATGTGRRALHIKALTGLDYDITGIDISINMCRVASERGLRTFCMDWTTDDESLKGPFDVITFLYAFGHIATIEERKRLLLKVSQHLSEDGMFYFDVFSLENKNEWGPQARQAYLEKDLYRHGYEEGDVFYQKRGLKELAFLHYFKLNEIAALLKEVGLEIKDKKFIGYAKNPGEFTNDPEQGNIFIAAGKMVTE